MSQALVILITENELQQMFATAVQQITSAITAQGEKIMGTSNVNLSDVQASVQTLITAQQAAAAEITQIGSEVGAAVTDIQNLNTQIAALQNSGGASPAQLADLKTSIDAITSNLNTSTAALTTSANNLANALPAPPAPAPVPPTGGAKA